MVGKFYAIKNTVNESELDIDSLVRSYGPVVRLDVHPDYFGIIEADDLSDDHFVLITKEEAKSLIDKYVVKPDDSE